jgi:pSer/pThr/pTyr-binding forkhead associated (FHA) protein
LTPIAIGTKRRGMGVRLLVASEGSSASAAEPSASSAPRETSPAETCWEFAQARVVLGRAGSSDVVLPHPSVSARHATIEADGVRYVLVDHGSLNGTWVNGARIVPERPKPLRDGDVLTLGLFRVRFVANVPVNDVPSRERTVELARRLLRAARGAPDASLARRITIANGPDAGRVLSLSPPPARLVVGRGEACDLVLADGDASREHAELIVDADGVVVRDTGSKNGVLVGERRVPERRLADRDEIRIGATVLVFEDPSEPSLRSVEAMPDEPAPPPRSSVPAPPAGPPTASAEASAGSASAGSASAPSETGPASSESEGSPAGDRDGDARLDSTSPRRPSDPPPRGSVPARQKPAFAAGEWAVYGLALVVFLLSAVGLAWLLRGP